MKSIRTVLWIISLLIFTYAVFAEPITPRVEVEEEVYSYIPANNGAGPMWCHGNTCIVRLGDQVYASGIETITGAKPLNNCLPLLFERTDMGWRQIYQGEGRTREPNPLASFPDGRVLLSINPTLTQPDADSGPAKPQILEFIAKQPMKSFQVLLPTWEGEPEFTEHSYRSFAADGAKGELILLQNIEYTHAEWSFRDHDGKWSAQGKLLWPMGNTYEKPQPIRVCYPSTALKNRAVYFLGVSDIEEPYQAWRDYKKQLTGRDWDYDFRRLFYTWSEDISTGKFHDWIEVASRDKTCGWVFPQDLYVAPNGDVFILWTERAIDERLREKFFPGEKQKFSLELAVIRDGKVIHRHTMVQGGEDLGGERPGDARFQVTEAGRIFVFYYLGGTDAQGKPLSDYRLAEIAADGKPGENAIIKLKTPFSSFFTATVRAGCRPSNFLDLYGAVNNTMRYARIRIQ